jgi:hypothetical protein
MADGIAIYWMDATTGEEVEGVNFPKMGIAPRAGDRIHYWQDGTGEPGEFRTVARRDFLVASVGHDLRYTPGRDGRAGSYSHTLMVRVDELEPPK